MKKIFMLLTAGVCSAVTVFAQTDTSLKVNDTRYVDEPPGTYPISARFDFKYRYLSGVPGTGNYGTMMTITPWVDASGDGVHQLNFNDGGIFYRWGIHGGSWNNWAQVLTSHGNQAVNGAFQINTDNDAILNLVNTDSGGWSYMSYFYPDGRRAYMGITPSNDLEFKKEGGGQIVFSGANVGIGISDPWYLLTVGGTIGARKVKVTQETWSDFVFADDYRLPTLYEMEQFIRQNKHLPDIPGEAEVKQEGLDLGEINKQLLQKLEEFSLYLIQHQKELDALKAENAALKEAIKKVTR